MEDPVEKEEKRIEIESRKSYELYIADEKHEEAIIKRDRENRELLLEIIELSKKLKSRFSYNLAGLDPEAFITDGNITNDTLLDSSIKTIRIEIKL